MQSNSVVLKGSRRVHREGAQVLGRTDPHEWCEVTLKLRRKAPLPEPTPQGPPRLTLATLEAKHGAGDDDIETVLRALTPRGLKILSKHRATRSIHVAGPASA